MSQQTNFESFIGNDGYLWFKCKFCMKESKRVKKSSIPLCVKHGLY